jgi:hypothetical protein
MSDTPRTDAFENLGFLDQQMTWWEFARQLERELAATQILLHESLAREDRFYRELAAKDTEKYCYASCAFFAAKDKEASK